MTQGRQGLPLDLGPSPLILGGNVFGWTADRRASFAVLDAFVSGGGRMIDTADRYSAWVPSHVGGESETMIGEWLEQSGRRDSVLIATKVGLAMGDGTQGLAPERIARAIEASLRRLQTDYVDLYIAHKDDPLVRQEAIAEAFDRLVQAGKVRVVGASNFEQGRLQSAIEAQRRVGAPTYRFLQNRYNLLERGEFEGPMQDFCVRHGIGMTPYYGLASGFLTGKYRSESDFSGKARGAVASLYFNPHGLKVLATLDALSSEYKTSPVEISLAWLASQPGVVAPIASATTTQQVDQLLAASSIRLSPEALALLDQSSKRACE